MGGDSHQGFGTPIAGSEVRERNAYGIFKLTLHATTYDWKFLPVAGSTFTDSGTGNVVRTVANAAPVAVADSYSTTLNTAADRQRAGRPGQRHRLQRRSADRGPRHQRHPRHAEPELQRRLHLYADQRVHGCGQLHLPRQ